MTAETENKALKGELVGLFQYIQRVRMEIAAISRDADETEHFESMTDQLEAIVSATGVATNGIISAMESNMEQIDELKILGIKDEAQLACLDKILANGQDVFEACSFQDITGQRVTKVAKSVTYVEKRVASLIDIWGREHLDKIAVKASGEDKTDDEKLLHGPQLEKEQSMNQAEIDALFD